MRKIKFRAWYKNKMLDVKSLMSDNYIVIPLCRYPYVETVICKEIMQFTGLTDKNRKEIYEGDILQDFRKTFRYECVFRDNNGAFEFLNLETLNYALLHEIHHAEIIGNVYESPELNVFEKKQR